MKISTLSLALAGIVSTAAGQLRLHESKDWKRGRMDISGDGQTEKVIGSKTRNLINRPLFDSPVDIEKGKQEPIDVTPYIVGGTTVNPPRKYKFFVWLNGCGGSLIAPNIVLSAAHCGDKDPADYVTLGMHKLVLDDDEADEFLNIEHIPILDSAIHPDYKGNPVPVNDFWMIRLKWGSQLYADQAAELDTTMDDLDLDDGFAHELITMGFGTLESGGDDPNEMQEVTVDYVPNDECGDYDDKDIKSDMLCAGRAGKDSCNGDSGGPIIHKDSWDNGIAKIVGIVSWGYGCADENYPGVYARVSEGMPFIDTYLNEWTEYALGPPSTICTDFHGFYDDDADSCMWYDDGSGKRCTDEGNSHANAGLTANTACCTCGGGTPTGMTPSNAPTSAPTSAPTKEPTSAPTDNPITPSPTAHPVAGVTDGPTSSPSKEPTASPTQSPSKEPTGSPTQMPTGMPIACLDKFEILNGGCPGSGLDERCCSGECFTQGGNGGTCKG